MEESPPAPVPPEVTAAPEETVAQEEMPRAEPRRLRVPTSVLVTVLVAALSVWVAPAFTRQWEDRKQARELQAQMAEDIALATARTTNRIEAARVPYGKAAKCAGVPIDPGAMGNRAFADRGEATRLFLL